MQGNPAINPRKNKYFFINYPFNKKYSSLNRTFIKPYSYVPSSHMYQYVPILVTNPFTLFFPTHWEYRLTHPPGVIASPKWFRPKTTFVSLHHNHLLLSPSQFPRGNKNKSIFPPPSAKHAEFRKRTQTNKMSLSSTSGISPKPLYLRHKNQ